MNISAKNIIGFKDFRINSGKYLDKVKRGQSFLVMQRSKPVFGMVPVDEWGDEGHWKTLIDFTKIYKGKGIPADELLKKFRDFEKKHGSHR